MTHPLERVRDKLGRMPDSEVAALAGVSADEVKLYRREHGIAPFLRQPPSFASAPRPAPQLRVENGPHEPVVLRRRTSPEGDTAEVVSRPPTAIVAALDHPLAAYHDRLGKVADQAIADETGVPRTAVGDYRRKQGIPAYDGFRHQPRKAPAPAVEEARHGRRSVIDPYLHLLGTVPDAEIAAMAGVTREAVTKLRGRRGIAGFGTAAPGSQPSAPPPVAEEAAQVEAPLPSRRASKLDAFRTLVGVLSDAEVAARAGMSAEGVRMYRRRHGIAAGTHAPAPETGAPVDTAAPPDATPTAVVVPEAPTREREPPAPAQRIEEPAPAQLEPTHAAATWFAFAVVAVRGDEERRFVSVGADIGEALPQAQAALAARSDGPWRVRSIRDLVEALVAPAPAQRVRPHPVAPPPAPSPPASEVMPTTSKEAEVAAPPLAGDDEPRPYTGADLLAYRRDKGLSQKQLGARFGVSQSVLSILERKSDTPLAPHLQRAFGDELRRQG